MFYSSLKLKVPTFEILLRKYRSSLRKLKIIFSNYLLENNEILEKFFIRSFGWFKTNSFIFWWGLSHHKSWFWNRLVWLVSTKSHNKKAGFQIDKFVSPDLLRMPRMNLKTLPVMAKIPVEVNTQKSLNGPKIVRKQFW